MYLSSSTTVNLMNPSIPVNKHICKNRYIYRIKHIFWIKHLHAYAFVVSHEEDLVLQLLTHQLHCLLRERSISTRQQDNHHYYMRCSCRNYCTMNHFLIDQLLGAAGALRHSRPVNVYFQCKWSEALPLNQCAIICVQKGNRLLNFESRVFNLFQTVWAGL